MDIKTTIIITVVCSALLSSSVAAPFQQAETCSDLKKIWQRDVMTALLSNAAVQEIDLPPKEREERDKTLCVLLKYSLQCVFQLNLPMGDKFCEAIKEHEKPDKEHQRMLYDFILKHLQPLSLDDDTGY